MFIYSVPPEHNQRDLAQWSGIDLGITNIETSCYMFVHSFIMTQLSIDWLILAPHSCMIASVYSLTSCQLTASSCCISWNHYAPGKTIEYKLQVTSGRTTMVARKHCKVIISNICSHAFGISYIDTLHSINQNMPKVHSMRDNTKYKPNLTYHLQ